MFNIFKRPKKNLKYGTPLMWVDKDHIQLHQSILGLESRVNQLFYKYQVLDDEIWRYLYKTYNYGNHYLIYHRAPLLLDCKALSFFYNYYLNNQVNSMDRLFEDLPSLTEFQSIDDEFVAIPLFITRDILNVISKVEGYMSDLNFDDFRRFCLWKYYKDWDYYVKLSSTNQDKFGYACAKFYNECMETLVYMAKDNERVCVANIIKKNCS